MVIGKKFIIRLLSLIIFVISFSALAKAKSVYVISNINYKEIQAYKVDANSLIHQVTTNTTYTSPVGIAIGESEHAEFLFLTFEFSNMIEIINAKTMEPVDTMTVPNVSNNGLVGITTDNTNSKIYMMDRYTNHLYSYSWNPSSKTLTPDFNEPYYIELQGMEYNNPNGAFGIALDEINVRLYVGDNTNKIKYYDTNDPNWSKEGEIIVSCNVIGVAIDVGRQLLYYGSMGGYGQGDIHLYQYNISSGVEQSVIVGTSVAGIAVDQQTGLVYITTYEGGSYPDRLMIYNSALVKQNWESGDIGNPAGVAVGTTATYKPPLFYLEKVDVNEPNCVIPDDYITYRLTYGPNGVDHNNVVLTDSLSFDVHFVSADNNGVYDSNLHTVTWNISPLEANDPCDSVTLTVKVNECILECGTITNFCEAESDSAYNTAEANTPVCSASSPKPTCGEIVDLDTGEFNLTWCPGLFAADVNGHEVYFGSNFNDVNNADINDPNVYKGPVTDPCYPIEFNDLDVHITYYWRIDEVNTNHPDVVRWRGGVWSFTTGIFLIVEDFDSYANDEELWAVWHDRYTGGVNAYVYLETGATNANLVHDGNSMEYQYYDNASPYYSEAYVDTVNLPSQIGADWTVSGVKALVLYFYGQPLNSADPVKDRMWVALSDGTHTGVVKYPDMNDIKVAEWHEWNVDLADPCLASVVMTNVSKLYIGFGVRGGSTVNGGTGTVYFDDIRLYLRRSPADFDRDEIVNFLDYAHLANAWQDVNANYSLEVDNNLIDINDLDYFCDDWLWQLGMSRGMARSMASTSGFAEVAYPPEQLEPELEPQPEPQPQPEVTEEQETYPSPPAPLASAMPLSLQISVNGDPEPVDSEIILSPSETLILDIWTNAEIYSQGGLEGYFVIGVDPMYGTISGGVTVPPWNSEASVALYGGNSGNAYLPAPEQGILGAIATFLPQGFGITGVIFDQIVFHCEAPGDAVINLYVTDFVTLTLVDSVTVHQIPEQ